MNVDAKFGDGTFIKLPKAEKFIPNDATLGDRLNDNIKINVNEMPTIWRCLQFGINFFHIMSFTEEK